MTLKTERFDAPKLQSSKTERFQPANSNLGATIRQSANFISGKKVPNYTLLFLDPSLKNKEGEHENIVLPNITIGRGDKCHVRYGDNYNTVSREHVSISYGDDKFVLNHNTAASNPTFVNGKQAMGPTPLQNGDEIQLSSQGPRFRFMTGQMGQSKMGFTARLGSAVGQAIRPYKRAVMALAFLFIAALGFGIYSIFQNKGLSEDLEQSSFAIESLNQEINSKSTEVAGLEKKVKSIANKNSKESQALTEQLNNSKMELENNRRQLAELQKVQQSSRDKIAALEAEKAQQEEAKLAAEEETDDVEIEEPEDRSAEAEKVPLPVETANFKSLSQGAVFMIVATSIEFMSHKGFKKLDASKLDPDSGSDALWSGTAFLTENGKLITARQNIQPWRFINENPEEYKEYYQSINQIELEFGDVNVIFELYDETGKLQILESKEAILDDGDDEVIKQKVLDKNSRRNKVEVKQCTNPSTNWAYFPIVGTKSNVQTVSKKAASKLSEGTELIGIGYASGQATKPGQNLSPLFFKGGIVNKTKGMINASNILFPTGTIGGPAYAKVDGDYKVVGIVGPKSVGLTSSIILISNIR